MSGTRGGPLPHPQPGHFSHRCEWPLSARKHVPRVHTGHDSRHKALAASAFPLLVGHQCLTLARKYVPCVHAKRGFRQSSPRRRADARKPPPRVHARRRFRQGAVSPERFPCWHGVCAGPMPESLPRVYTRDAIPDTGWHDGRSSCGEAGRQDRPDALTRGGRRHMAVDARVLRYARSPSISSSVDVRKPDEPRPPPRSGTGLPLVRGGRAYLSSIVPLELRSSPPRVLGRHRFRIRIRTMAEGTRCEHFRRRIFAQSLGRN